MKKLIITGCTFLLIAGLLGSASYNKIENPVLPDVDTVIDHGDPFSEENLVKLLKDCNVKYPHIVLAQAKLESGNFRSKLFKQNNNMFGMKKARRRATTAKYAKSGFAYYTDWVDCVYDYILYQDNILSKISNEKEYFAKLGRTYAQSPTYVSKLKYMIEVENLKSKF